MIPFLYGSVAALFVVEVLTNVDDGMDRLIVGLIAGLVFCAVRWSAEQSQ